MRIVCRVLLKILWLCVVVRCLGCVVCGSLFVVGCVLFDVCCLSLSARSLWFSVAWCLFFVVVRCVTCVDCVLFIVVSCLLRGDCCAFFFCLSFVVRWLFLVVCFVLRVVALLLFVVECLCMADRCALLCCVLLRLIGCVFSLFVVHCSLYIVLGCLLVVVCWLLFVFW